MVRTVHGTNGLHVVRTVRGTNSQWYEQSSNLTVDGCHARAYFLWRTQ